VKDLSNRPEIPFKKGLKDLLKRPARPFKEA